jgi:hypothetical protein
MISPTMVSGSILVKAKKIGESSDFFYLEFELTESQKMQFVTELILAHSKNGTLKLGDDEPNDLNKMKFLKQMISDNPKMDENIKSEYLKQILSLSKSVGGI